MATCPSYLKPGERGTFEVFAAPPTADPPASSVLPLQLAVGREILGAYELPGEEQPPIVAGLAVRTLATDSSRRLVVGQVTNETTTDIRYVEMCANFRGSDGHLLEVASIDPYVGMPILDVAPGEARTFALYFNSMPPGEVELVARGSKTFVNRSAALSPSLFKTVAMRQVNTAYGPVAEVIGELDTSNLTDIGGLQLSAHISGKLTDRVDGLTVGCSGLSDFPTTPVAFTVPIAASAFGRSVIIEALRASSNQGLDRLSVVSVASASASDGSRLVSATIKNPKDYGVRLRGTCFNLRAKNGQLVGTTPFADQRYIGPGQTTQIEAKVEAIEVSSSADVVAFGGRSSPPK